MSPNNSPRLIHSLTNKFLFQELKSSSDLILKRQSSRNRKLPEREGEFNVKERNYTSSKEVSNVLSARLLCPFDNCQVA